MKIFNFFNSWPSEIDAFISVWCIGILLILLQAIFASKDGYLTKTQMREKGLRGYSFFQHGGIWANVFITSPIISRVLTHYSVSLDSFWVWIILVFTIIFTIVMGVKYAKDSHDAPEAHAHNGKTTIAGWIYGLYSVLGIWCILLFYLGQLKPTIEKEELVFMAILLSFFFVLGVIKFSPKWKFSASAKWQVFIEILILWVVTYLKFK